MKAFESILLNEEITQRKVGALLEEARETLVDRNFVLQKQMGVQLQGRRARIQNVVWHDEGLHVAADVFRTDGAGFLDNTNRTALRRLLPLQSVLPHILVKRRLS